MLFLSACTAGRSPAPAQRVEKPHYVDVRSCRPCHTEIYDSYQGVAMARSFYRPAASNVIEDYEKNNRFIHAASNRHYRMLRRGGRFFQQRFQLQQGREVNLFEQEIYYIIGSGNHARSYLNLSAGGVLTQLPATWYPQEKRWGISPGYDRKQHYDFSRKIDYGCLFCHNATPKLAEGADRYGRENLFPPELPMGIDCQRCHGPASQHVALAGSGKGIDAIRRAIVNPARLSPERQMDVCQQCHLETTSDELPQAVRAFGRAVYSFRPGEALSDYLIHFDHAPGTGHDDKFEINSAAYRLRQSQCFQKSAGRLKCTSCHDPHRTPRGDEAIQQFRESCLKCHQQLSARSHPDPASAACATCHMPKRRTEDVVHVMMTDHRIQRLPTAKNLLASRKEDHTPYRGEVVRYFQNGVREAASDLYWGVAQVKQQSNLQALARFKAALETQQPQIAEPWAELSLAQLESGDLEAAKQGFSRALSIDPGLVLARYNLGRACQLLGQLDEAAAHYRLVLEVDGEHAEAHNNLGLVLQGQGQPAAAQEHFLKGLQRNPLFVDVHNNLGNVLTQGKHWAEAIASFEQALRIEPSSADAYNNLGKVWGAQGNLELAIRNFRAATAADPKHWIAQLNLAKALQAVGKTRESETALREAKRLNPKLRGE
jgi:predicted CXXCH cytochrome family protein